MLPLPEVILAATSLIFASLSAVFFIRFIRERQKSLFITKNQDTSFEILNDAMRKAQEIIGKAATTQMSAVGFTKEQSDKLEKAAEVTLEASTRKTDQLLEVEVDQLHQRLDGYLTQLERAQQDYIHYLQSLELNSEQTKKMTQEAMSHAVADQALEIKSKLNEFVEKLENDLTGFLHKSEEQSVHSLELELKSARQMIETYKTQQFLLIDENIMTILERTLSLVLSKKLTLRDHVDLIYESLEKAKLEKFIA